MYPSVAAPTLKLRFGAKANGGAATTRSSAVFCTSSTRPNNVLFGSRIASDSMSALFERGSDGILLAPNTNEVDHWPFAPRPTPYIAEAVIRCMDCVGSSDSGLLR